MTFATVTDYFASLPPDSARALRKVRAVVAKAVPGARGVISYNIPAFALGRPFMYCAAFKSHIGIYPPVRNDARLIKALAPFSNAKGNLRFPLDEPLPLPLIARVARALARQYAASGK
jgi:uncharacterized protein YdhG (YjbR/CyaY superfamily)